MAWRMWCTDGSATKSVPIVITFIVPAWYVGFRLPPMLVLVVWFNVFSSLKLPLNVAEASSPV